jgi:Tol biopolymer transport system component
VTSDGFNGRPVFTLDGTRLIFMRMPPGGEGDGLHLLDLATGELRRFLPDGLRGTSLQLLGDGETILFMPGYYNDQRVFSMQLDGSDLRQIAELPRLAEWLVASPDGRTLTDLDGGIGWRDIYALDVETGAIRQLTADDREHDDTG